MKEKVKKLVCEYSHGDVPDDTSYDLLESEVLDSFGMMNLVAVFEDEFNVELSSEDISRTNFCCIEAMCKMIERLQAV